MTAVSATPDEKDAKSPSPTALTTGLIMYVPKRLASALTVTSTATSRSIQRAWLMYERSVLSVASGFAGRAGAAV